MHAGSSAAHIDGLLRKTAATAQDAGDDGDGDDDDPENDIEVLVELIEDFQEVLETCQDGIDVCEDPAVCTMVQAIAVSAAGKIAELATMIANMGGVMYDGDEGNPDAKFVPFKKKKAGDKKPPSKPPWMK